MADTKIEWADKVWNPVRGCSRVSDGCRHCYAERQAMRQSGIGGKYHGLVRITNGHPQWTGRVVCDAGKLDDPRRWQQPARIFVNSMSDLFHDDVPDDFILKVWGVFADCPHHQFLVLTKRPQRMFRWVSGFMAEVALRGHRLFGEPLQNVWLGVSVENQETADQRIPLLLNTPAAVHWISAEPLLGPLTLLKGTHGLYRPRNPRWPSLNWVVAGGESGPGARPMNPEWALQLRNQCCGAGIPFFFKQWGNWIHVSELETSFSRREIDAISKDTIVRPGSPDAPGFWLRLGKKKAGRLLRGREWKEFPAVL